MEMEMSKKGRTLRIKTHAHYFSPVKEFARAKGTANYYETCFVVGVVGGCFPARTTRMRAVPLHISIILALSGGDVISSL